MITDMRYRHFAIALSVSTLVIGSAAAAQDAPRGITVPRVFAPYDPDRADCRVAPPLSKEIVFLKDNEREFVKGIGFGIEAAARDRGLAYSSSIARNDGKIMIDQVEALRAAGTGAIIVAPVDPAALAPSLRRIMAQGTYVGAVVPPPATSLLNAPQYLTGKVLGDAAAAHIRGKMAGKANVVLLTHDSLQFLSPRFAAIRDALKDLPDVAIVADISPPTVDKDGGYAMMQTILVAHPDVDVVLGADTVVLGAVAAIKAAGKIRPDQFFGGIDGEPEAVAQIKSGGPYKISVSLASSIFGYAMGQHAADWLEGKTIPQAMDILPSPLTIETISRYEQDLGNPGEVYRDRGRRDKYLRMYGNICFDSRDQYVDFPWSSERK